jgi:peptidoglycan/xylan/chitin deacetylase (PgdA/CDA1 family)
MKKIYFITYHYVRKIKKSKYPNLKGLEIDVFKSQLDKINKKFDILNFNSLLNIFKNKEYNLKRNACVLTFDDGYKDNIKYVLPELKKRNLSGFFFSFC